MSFYQDYETTPPPLFDDDDDNKLKDYGDLDVDDDEIDDLSNEEHFSSNTANNRNLDSHIFSCTPPPDDDIELEKLEIPLHTIHDDHKYDIDNETVVTSDIKEAKNEHPEISSEIEIDNDDIEIKNQFDQIIINNESMKFDFEETMKLDINESIKEEKDEEEVALPQVDIQNIDENVKNYCDENNETEEIQFEADFSAFEAHFQNEDVSTTTSTNQIDQLNVIEGKAESHKVEIDDDDDDDDFGDFNDFTQAPAAIKETVIQEEISSSQFVAPVTLLKSDDVNDIINQMFPFNKDIKSSLKTENNVINSYMENVVQYLKDIDTTLALNYDYKDSSTNHILIKALGIDERNILFGPQWISSSSNIPRFASDLSFNPLEPQKSSISSHKSEILNPHPIQQQQQPQIQQMQQQVVPEVEFDWNGAGLINPLDVKQISSNEVAAVVVTPTLPNNSVTVDDEIMNAFENKTDEINPSSNGIDIAKQNWQDDGFEFDISSAAPNHMIVRERVIKLPETHIFTPIKSVSPVSREVVGRDASLEENKREKSSVYVKEYHDVEYSLEPKSKIIGENDFSEFQSADFEAENKPTSNNLNILKPQKINAVKSNSVQPLNNIEAVKLDDSDFTEFQTAPCIISKPNTSHKEKEKDKKDNSITLSPLRLVNNLKTNNDIMSVNPSKYMNDSKSITDTNHDDEWCDFMSSQIPNVSSSMKSNDNDWSDFVSVPVPVAKSQQSSSINSSQLHSKPNFSPWNQPISKPYTVNHTTSFLSSYPSSFNQFEASSRIDERKSNKPMNITNNYSYSIDQQASNGISTLPDLHFALPKNMINLSRGGSSSDSNKK